MEYLPDQPHIDRIRNDLWQGRPYGQAAVMVGAGFSLNARPAATTTRRFPSLSDLAKSLIDALYPRTCCTAGEREHAEKQSCATSGILRLAEEFQAAFGRGALESLLLKEIPDLEFEPGPVHKLLLKLPWSDVLTTNYDTMLERACVGLVDRKYDVVRTISDIPTAMRPRITKLHGSFPSTRPFIFTEEDYRTYPRCFAPFVNLVQQVIMENVLCLVGFSGDDPNFLYWTGWVRDNLGLSRPNIYLCGLLKLTTARRNLLRDRNVVPVDLSPLFPAVRWPDEQVRHEKALEWLILTLEAGEPPDLRMWPHASSPDRTKPSEGLPAVPTPEHSIPLKEELWPK